MAKRTASTQAKTTATKKSKVAQTPVDKNFSTILQALSNDECIIPGPDSNRWMLVAVASAAMKTPKDQRHEDQHNVIAMVGEIFSAEKTRWEARVAEAASVVDAAKSEQAEKTICKDTADAALRAQKQEVSTKMEAQSIAMEVVRESEEELQKARDMHTAAEADRMKIVQEQEHAFEMQHLIKISKEGTAESPKESKKHIIAITSFFKGIGAEEALVKVLPQILGRKPEERGSFDEIALQQLDSYLDNHLSLIVSRIEAASVDVKEHDVAATAWGSAVELCQEKKCDSDAALKASQEHQEQLEIVLSSARKALREHGTAMKKLTSMLAIEQVGLQYVEEVLEALHFLQEYTTPPPQEEIVEMEEVTTEQPIPEEEVTIAEPVPEVPAKVKEMAGGMDLPDMPSPAKRSRAASLSTDIPMVA